MLSFSRSLAQAILSLKSSQILTCPISPPYNSRGEVVHLFTASVLLLTAIRLKYGLHQDLK
jgi:hypothetical protein